jgi:hypothetical protein
MTTKVKRKARDRPRRAKESKPGVPGSQAAPADQVFRVRRLAARVRPLAHWFGPVAIALAGLAMLRLTWRTWPDVQIDFGRELYVPWRLAEGQVLYTDVAYFNGPLSPYWNSLWFRLLGASVMTLVASNLILLAVLTALLYVILRDIGSRFSATAACVVFMMLFAFGQFLEIGNYNFVTPYSHEVTHGVLLSVAALFCLRLYHTHHRPIFVAAAGLAVGLLYLTKVEVFLAGAAATAIGVGLTLWAERADGRGLRALVAFLLGAAVPLTLTPALFWLAMPLGQALREPLGYWLSAFRSDVTSLPFYRLVMGMDDISANAQALLISATWYLVVLGPVALLALAVRKPGVHRLVLTGAAFVAVLAVLGAQWRDIGWQAAGRALPLFMLALAVVWIVFSVRRLRRSEIDHSLILRLSLTVFALVLLGKMILNARVIHYGFALAMPATLLLVVALLEWVPAAIDGAGGHGAAFRGAALAALLVATFVHVYAIDQQTRRRFTTVSAGADAFLADARGAFVNKAIEVLRSHARPGQTLAVLPEGVMLNFLSRHVNPTPYFVFLPLELALFGEDRMVASLAAHPPDYAMLVHRDTNEYGVRYFGRDYGQKIYAWLAANYRPLHLVGAQPFQSARFGILLLKKKDPT